MRFRAEVQRGGKTATGILVPPEVVAGLGAGKRPPVRVTINGHTYRSTLAPRGDVFKLGISAENRELAGVTAGDEVDVELGIEEAKTPETRERRIGKAVDRLREGRGNR